MTAVAIHPFDLERVFRAMDRIKERLLRATAALDAAGVPYAVIGGNAVANWVSLIRSSAVRMTKDVDLLLRREDVDAAGEVLSQVGFVPRRTLGMAFFQDGSGTPFEDAVHVVYAGERVRATDLVEAPQIDESEQGTEYRVLKLESLVRMKLTSWRRKDQTHLVDMINLGMIDHSWRDRFPPALAERLRELLDDENERSIYGMMSPG